MSSFTQEAIIGALDEPAAVGHLREYFGLGSGPGFTGRLFQRIGGRGDADDVADRVTADDLIAVEALSVQVPIEVAHRLLDGELGSKIHDLLSQIPVTARAGTKEAELLLADDAAADQAWNLLVAEKHVNYVIAGKLLARKRPNLIPVYDSVVSKALGAPEHAWEALNSALSSPEVARRVRELRVRSGIDDGESDLRLIDVTLWMKYR